MLPHPNNEPTSYNSSRLLKILLKKELFSCKVYQSQHLCNYFFLVVGLHNFENIPPQLFLQSKTFIHFMNAGNLILSPFIFHRLSHIDCLGTQMNLERPGIAVGKNVEDILWGKQCAVNCVNTLGALWLSSIYGTSRPRRETREDHHEEIFIYFGGYSSKFLFDVTFWREKILLSFGWWLFLVVRKFDHRPK